MKRKIIQIDDAKCNGCGACVSACHEGAIAIKNGKAVLLRDDSCDGLGDCLPACPAAAISFIERKAAPYNDQAVKANIAKQPPLPCGCPGTQVRVLNKAQSPVLAAQVNTQKSQLAQWPVQIKLVPQNAPYLKGAHLLIAADCAAYAYANFHNDFIMGRIALIGCPKLDNTDYSQKFTELIKNNDIKTVTVARMAVPCCGGLEEMAKAALIASGKTIPWSINIITVEGNLQDL